jgi:hypothetical protein
MASLTDLSDLPSLSINQTTNYFDNDIVNKQESPTDDDDILAKEEFDSVLNDILNNDGDNLRAQAEVTPMSALSELRDDTMEVRHM